MGKDDTRFLLWFLVAIYSVQFFARAMVGVLDGDRSTVAVWLIGTLFLSVIAFVTDRGLARRHD